MGLKSLERDINTKHHITTNISTYGVMWPSSRATLYAVHYREAREGGKVQLIFGARYIDRFEKRDGALGLQTVRSLVIGPSLIGLRNPSRLRVP